jgi:AcrR family transcriptional regulator
MGRPREHDEQTAAALLAAAERIIEDKGIEALSVRTVASAVGTTTRAVYTSFGSKEGMIAALAAHAFELLHDGLRGLTMTDDPRVDLVSAGLMFRSFATEHPSLFAIGVQRNLPQSSWPQVFTAAGIALQALKTIIGRLADEQLLGERTVDHATCQFHALCEGLAAIELRGLLPPQDAEVVWEQALGALVSGFAVLAPERLERAR